MTTISRASHRVQSRPAVKRLPLVALLLLASLGVAAFPPGPTAALSAQTTPPEAEGLGVIFNERGRVSLSMDALGMSSTTGQVTIDKPAGATVRRAVLFAATTGFLGYDLAAPIGLDGVGVAMDHRVPSTISSFNYWTDVTSQLRGKVDSHPAGPVSFTVDEPDSFFVDGTALAVVFDDPTVTSTRSVALMFGALKTTGDLFTIRLEQPFSATSALEMALGISYGHQGTGQYSTVTVNDRPLTSSAGGQDDGEEANGALITVGGVGDSSGNPIDPLALPTGARSDDERYDLRPFIPVGTTTVSVATQNPSNDDNIFLAAFVGDPPITQIITDDGPNWSAWTIGDVHAHAAGDTNLVIHPSCGGLADPIGAAECADRLVAYTAASAARFDADWIVLTEHAPWLGFKRNAAGVVYDSVQGAAEFEEVLRAAQTSTSPSLALLSGAELGTAAPACSAITTGALPFVDGPVIDSPGHYGVYSLPGFIDNGIFDCSETGYNGYAGDTEVAGGFGGINHPRNADGGSRWHCWHTSDDSGIPRGDEDSPISLGYQQCALGIDAYAVAEPGDVGAFRTIELISGHNLPQKSSLEHWDAMLQNRYVVAPVGGGDGHTAPRKQDLGNALSCLIKQERGESAPSVFACFIDKGGKVKDPNIGKTGGSGRTMVLASKDSLAGAGVGDPANPVRTAIRNAATIATNGPDVLARVGGALPGGTVQTSSDKVAVRVDWQAAFKHAGDTKNYCTDAEKVGDGECPNSYSGLTFDDIRNGAMPRDPKVANAVPDEVVIVVGPRTPCGRDDKKCQKNVVRTRILRGDLTEAELAERSFTREVTVPGGDSYVRVEWYSDTGDANKGNDKYFDKKVWDFGALTSPIFVERPASAASARTSAAAPQGPSTEPGRAPEQAPRAVARQTRSAAAAAATPVLVVDLYGRPLADAQVSAFAVDLAGHTSSTAFNNVRTGADGRAVLQLDDGDHFVTVTRSGCTGAGTPAAARTPVFNVPVDDPVAVLLDCKDPDTESPTVRVTGGPEGVVSSIDATFTFEASDGSGKVRTGCLLDQVDMDELAIDSCTSPMTYEGVGAGQHTFQVVAVDPNGNLSPVATRTFFVTTPVTPPPLYRARQTAQGNGAAAPNVVVERNVALAGLNDSDPDRDGWAELGRTQSANERGHLEAFELSSTGAPTIVVDYDKPPDGRWCYSATVDITRVTSAERRLIPLSDPVAHPDCFADGASDAFPAGGPLYR